MADAVGATAGQGWLRRLWGYVGRYRRHVLLAFGASVLGTLCQTVTPLVARHVIDVQIVGRRPGLGAAVVLLVALGAARFGLGYVRRWFAGRLSLDVQYDMRDDVFASLQRIDGARQDEIETGQLVSRANSDITLVQGLLAFMPMVAGQFLLFVTALVVMLVLSPSLTLVALAVAPALTYVAIRSRRRLFPATWDVQQQAGVIAGIVEEDVTGVRVVKGFGQEDRELHRLAAAAQRLFASRLRAVKLTARYQPALQTVPSLGQVGVLAYGGWLVLHHHLSLGTFLAFSTYVAALASPVRVLAGLLTIGQQAKAGVIRVVEVIDSQPAVTDTPGAEELGTAVGEIELDDVSFGYVRSRPVLNGLSLTVRPGETVALVGASGSGKSTISLLLPRFYDVQQGSVRLDGHDVRGLTLASLRRQIGVVFEDPFLFSASVRANIAYGVPDATDEQVRSAARLAEADEFIRQLPEGYESVVGEQGLTLSGGQRQRIALARALLTDPRVLLLDDATSALDAKVEAEVLATLRRVMAGRTTVLVAHRRSTLDLADRIVVLAEGQVVASGTFDELWDSCPLFRLLLSGPGSDAEGIDAGAILPVAPGAARRWPREAMAATVGENATTPSAVASAAAQSAAAGGAFAGALAAIPATPDLLAQVAALPPATDVPAVSLADASRADHAFGLRSLLRPLRRPLGLAMFLTALDATASLALPALTRDGVNAAVTKHSTHLLTAASVAALLVVVADWLVDITQTLVAGRTGERLLYTLRIKTFAQLQRLGLDYYEHELGGRIMTRMTTDVDALSNFLQNGVATSLVSVLQFFGVMIAMLVLDVKLALGALSVLPVLVVTTFYFRRYSAAAYTEARERVSAVNADLQENLSGVRVAQAFTREGRNASRFRDLADRYRQSRLRAQRAVSIYFPFVEFLSEIATAAVLAVGAHRVIHGGLQPGVLIAFLLYVDLFFSPVQNLSQVFDAYQQAAVGLRRVGDLLRTPTSTPEIAEPLPWSARPDGEIRLENVTFRYPGVAEAALSDVDLVIPAGQTVALVGETGAGKSTLVKLVARFYDASAGTVRIDGQDVRELALTSLRQHLGVVPQEPFLFAGSVRDNIAYGRPDATDAEVEAAARRVGADDVIAGFPWGYLSQVGERGRSLAAGQRQLVSLARAELVDPEILLLDEATAALDLASEAAYVASAEAVAHHRTTLVVAHRLTTAARADRVIVLAGGRVVEDGPPHELLGRNGPYAALWATYQAGLDGVAPARA